MSQPDSHAESAPGIRMGEGVEGIASEQGGVGGMAWGRGWGEGMASRERGGVKGFGERVW